MAQLWQNYWQWIVPGAFLAAALICGIADGDHAVRVKKFPKIRIWLLFAATEALFLLWHSVGMYFWEMGLRPVLFVLMLAFGALFVLQALGSRRCAGGRMLTWLTYLFLNLIPGWFLGIICAGVFQTLYHKGPEGLGQALVGLVSQVIFWGVVLFVVVAFFSGGDDHRVDTAAKDPARQNLLRDKTAEVNDLIGYRNDRASAGADVSDLDHQIARLKQEIHEIKRGIR